MPEEILKKLQAFPIAARFAFFLLSCYTLFFLLHSVGINNSFVSIPQLILGIPLFFLSGSSTVVILQWIFRRTFTLWEFLSLSVLGSILFFPLLLLVEFSLLGYVYSWFPLINSIGLSLLASLALFTGKTQLDSSLSIPTKISITHPLGVALTLFFFFILTIVSAYQALPDLDPYRWVFRYTSLFSFEQLDLFVRPLFGALTFTGISLLGIQEIFSFYKYVLPFLFMAISLPAWLVARELPSRSHQYIFMLLLFTSPSILLYGTTAMPNALMMILAYYFLFFLIYAFIAKDPFFSFIAGGTIFLSFFYHEASIIIFLPWLAFMLLFNIKVLFKEKKVVILVILLLITNISQLSGILGFVENWMLILYGRFTSGESLNLLFPAYYRNIDQNLMGWPGMEGVLKYYAFHVGPMVGTLLLLTLTLFVAHKPTRTTLLRIFTYPGLFSLLTVFTLYFTIAEILPRYPNVGLLPDRAWIFAGIFSLLFGYLILKTHKHIPRFTLTLTYLIVAISMAGALYVNHLKKYTVSPAQLRSATWIKENLPENRLFLSSGNKNLLPVHADSRLIRISQEAYCEDITRFQDIINQMTDPNLDTENSKRALQFSQFFESMRQSIKKYQAQYDQADTTQKRNAVFYDAVDSLKVVLSDNLEQASASPGLPLISLESAERPSPLSSEIPTQNYILRLNQDKLYIYYSRLNEKNPYGERPYRLSTWGFKGCPDSQPLIFDQYPERFKKIYDDHGEVIIWEVL